MPDTLHILDGAAAGTAHPLVRGRMLVGSDPACPVAVPEAAPRHAAVEHRDGGWTVRGLDGAAVLLAGAVIDQIRLGDGQEFTVAGIRLRFQAKAGAAVTAAVSSASAAVVPAQTAAAGEPLAEAARLRTARDRLLAQAEQTVIGQRAVLEHLLVALLADGHCLLVGAPGLAKTLMVKVLAASLDLRHARVQFTPDLMPADLTGTEILDEDPATGERRFRFRPGPVFTSVLLADEINRTPPKTQAALLEAMQERRVTGGGTTRDLPRPFFVLATQNPIEQEGTYPLPEAQLDRFLFCLRLDYPSAADEQRILLQTTGAPPATPAALLGAEDILAFQRLVRQVPVSPHVAQYATDLIRATRPGPEAADWVREHIRWGAGTRAGQSLLLAAKAAALLAGRAAPSCADVRAYALPVLRHRIVCTFAAAAAGIDADALIAKIVAAVREPAY